MGGCEKKPNVLVVICDTLRPDFLSVYGGDVSTETFETLEDRGTLFERAYAAGPGSSISHASIFSGLYPVHSGVGGQVDVPPDVTTIAQHLHNAGYDTFGMPGPSRMGSHWGYDRGFEEYLEKWQDIPSGLTLEDLRLAVNDPNLVVPMPAELLRRIRFGDDKYTSYLLDIFERKLRALEKPFFGLCNLTTVHNPFDPPRPYKEEATPSLVRPLTGLGDLLNGEEYLDRDDVRPGRVFEAQGHGRAPRMYGAPSFLNDAELEVLRDWYSASIRYLDDQLSATLKSLRRSGELDNTVVILTADHGEYFGEHDMIDHMHFHFDPCLHVPLVVAGPSVPAGERREDYVSLVDLFPTVCDLVGVEPPDGLDGRSLFGPEAERRSAVFAENGVRPVSDVYDEYLSAETVERLENGLKSVRTEEYLYTIDSRGEERVYELPGETEVRPDDDVLERLRGMVSDELGETFPPGTQEDQLDASVEANLRKLGYIQ